MSKRETNPMAQRLAAVYGSPDTPDPDGYLREFRRQLDGFDDAVLHEAADRIFRDATKAKRAWPAIGVCLAHCQAIVASQAHSKAAEQLKLSRPVVHRSYAELSPLERKRLHAFTDAVADGEIEIFHSQPSMGFLGAQLRGMAMMMRAMRNSGK